MKLDRDGTGEVNGWQAALILAPLLGIAMLLVAALLIYAATHGRWGAFAVLLGVELLGLAMVVNIAYRDRARG